MEDNHRVEVRVYVQKVKHLEYEHRNNLKGIEIDGSNFNRDEYTNSDTRVHTHKDNKRGLKEELRERDLNNAEEIRNVKQQHEKILMSMREGFMGNLGELKERCERKLGSLEGDLELRRKVDIHEIEERKNLHINDLMR